MDKMTQEKIKTPVCLNIVIYIGNNIAVITEATETILVIRKSKIQVKIIKPNITFRPGNVIAKPNKTPNVAATPLPPLNPKNMLQLCPHIQAKPKTIRNISWSVKKTTAAKPLKTSKANTVIPAGLPNILKALVAPTLPEPNLRISMPFNNLPNRYAVGREPIR